MFIKQESVHFHYPVCILGGCFYLLDIGPNLWVRQGNQLLKHIYNTNIFCLL